jgi:hypothetical protein
MFMIKQFDIIRTLPDASEPVWIDAVESVQAAKALIEERIKKHPAEYMVFDKFTGKRIVFKLDSN